MRSIIVHTTIVALLLPGALAAQAPAAPPRVPPAPIAAPTVVAVPHAQPAAASVPASRSVAAPVAMLAARAVAAPAPEAVAALAPEAVAALAPRAVAAPAAARQSQANVARQRVHADAGAPHLPYAPLLSPYPQDPADAMYRRAREALNSGDYRRSAQLFAQIPEKWPRSKYAAQAYYWQAFALSRGNASTESLRTARAALATLRSRYPDAEVRDAQALVQTINAQLAELGDVQGGAAVRRAATVAQQQGCPDADDEDDTRIVALNALLQMDAESALPILKQVLARRDACSAQLRRKAVFLVSQKRSPETAEILLDLVRNDPDNEVREQAIFWLSQVDGARAFEALEGILRTATDPGIQEKAIFALSQHRNERARELLRTFAQRTDAPTELRAQAIFWLGQSNAANNATFLRDLYGRIGEDELKEKIIFSLSQHRDPQNAAFLLDIALNERESMEMRKQSLFWAGQSNSVPLDRLIQLYDQVEDHEVKNQLIFVFAQRRGQVAMDKLMDIARNEPDAELRKQAIFWLGQSSDPRVAEFLLDLING